MSGQERAFGSVVERGGCEMTTLRRAAKRHLCDSCESASVRVGDAYLLHTAFPGHDWLDITRPRRSVECRGCAERYGRGHLLPEPSS